MRRGPWHQCGDRSQKLALEQIEKGVGVGVVLSPRDLSYEKAVEYAEEYHALATAVLIDQQFHVPASTAGKLAGYPISEHRDSISALHRASDAELSDLSVKLEEINRRILADAVVAPAVVYEAGRPEILELNGRLFRAARAVGDALGKPVYATVVLGQSATATPATIETALAHATSLDPDGWYYAYEFAPERIPSSREHVLRCCEIGLILACTGKPVMHAYAGPMGLLSLGFGATGVGIGHSQNLWKFDRTRWDDPDEQGGGGDAPARLFSSALWGTILHPDETAQLDAPMQKRVETPSPFAVPWDRWQANKHLVYVVGSTIAAIATEPKARVNAAKAIEILKGAVSTHQEIARTLSLRDSSGSYQANWLSALQDLLRGHGDDYDYLELVL